MAVVGMAANPLAPTRPAAIGSAVSSAIDRARCRSAPLAWSAGHGRRDDGQRQTARLNARSAAITSIMRASAGAVASSAAA